MQIDIFVRTHDRQNVHNDWRTRYAKMEKRELIQGCFNSLLNAVEYVKDHNVRLTVLDDHSSPEFVEWLKEKQKKRYFHIIHNEEKGYRYSAHQQFLKCRDSDADLVYCVEDDYLHTETAIQEMIDTYVLFSERLGQKNIVLYPFDAPEIYDPPKDQCLLVHGSNRHWRTGHYTTNVMFTIPKIFRDHWPLFEVLSLNYNGDYLRKEEEKDKHIRYEEANTIWNIWKAGHAMRFNPIPSIALHMQFDAQWDPFIEWKQWWKDYAEE